MTTTLSVEEYKNLFHSLAKRKFRLEKSLKASKGFTSTGHFIVHDTKGDSVELVPPKYILNVYKSLKDIEERKSEYQRLLILYVKEIQEAGYSTEMQARRIDDILRLYESASALKQQMNEILQSRISSSIDHLGQLQIQFEKQVGDLESKKISRIKSLKSGDQKIYAESAIDFHNCNRSVLRLGRELDEESRKLTGDQVFLIEAPSLKRKDVDLTDIRVRIS